VVIRRQGGRRGHIHLHQAVVGAVRRLLVVPHLPVSGRIRAAAEVPRACQEAAVGIEAVDIQKRRHQVTIDQVPLRKAAAVVVGLTIRELLHLHHTRRLRHLADTRARRPVQAEVTVVIGAVEHRVAVGINR
jgi:hypothetical protein